MASESEAVPKHDAPAGHDSVEMPRPTVAPLVLCVGMALLASGAILGLGFLLVGVAVLVVGLGLWIGQLLPGRGHFHDPLVEPERRPSPITGAAGTVGQLRTGMPGYRIRVPEEVHPISAGLKGGVFGGLMMPIPALLWGLIAHGSLWYPVNLLAGMVIPGIELKTDAELAQFNLTLLVVGFLIHAATSVALGVIYGVLLPTLPNVPRAMAWGGLLMPVLWTAASYLLMGVVNPMLRQGVEWPWFILSQFIFGIVAASVVVGARRLGPVAAGLLGGLIGGAVMPIPAVLWSLASGRGLWYPVNLLAAMVVPGVGGAPVEELQKFHSDWLTAALVMHAVFSLAFGGLLGFLSPKLPDMPGPLAWGALVLPALWTGGSFGLMGVVNPLLQQRIDWPWFIVSQFVFGLAAAVVVLRSEMIYIPPAGTGPERAADSAADQQGGQP
jgi:hypothetical protein